MTKAQPASAEYVNELRARWQERKTQLFERDGGHPTLPCGGHDIKNNRALQQTLDTIVENCYVQLCARKEELCEAEHVASLVATNRYSGTLERGAAECHIALFIDKKNDIDGELIKKNKEAIAMLLKSGSGLEREVQRMESMGETMDEQAKNKLAYGLISATIKTLVNCCREHLHGNGQEIGFVPGKIGGSDGFGR